MKNKKCTANNLLKVVAKKSIVNGANSTGCIIVYQPKAPNNLKKFSKLSDDK